jgi:hypothetical protein
MPSTKPKAGGLKASNESFGAGETTTGDMRPRNLVSRVSNS